MKKTLCGLISAALFLPCFVQASDTSATIDINGVLQQGDYYCAVILSESAVSILEESDTLIKQGDDATSPTIIHVSVDGDAQCADLITAGKIAYKFQGSADNADGTVLSNALTDTTAAKGVGIGIFDGQNKPIAVNTGRLPAKTDTTFGLQMVQLTNQQPVAGNINSTVTVQIERL